MNSETRTCQNCHNPFTIEPEDFQFYEKIKVPPPTFCPSCRFQRRLSFLNVFSLYQRPCDLCKKDFVAMYAADSLYTVYCPKCWWSDGWDPYKYGRDYDFYLKSVSYAIAPNAFTSNQYAPLGSIDIYKDLDSAPLVFQGLDPLGRAVPLDYELVLQSRDLLRRILLFDPELPLQFFDPGGCRGLVGFESENLLFQARAFGGACGSLGAERVLELRDPEGGGGLLLPKLALEGGPFGCFGGFFFPEPFLEGFQPHYLRGPRLLELIFQGRDLGGLRGAGLAQLFLQNRDLVRLCRAFRGLCQLAAQGFQFLADRGCFQ